MRDPVMEKYDQDIIAAKGDESKLDLILRSKWLYLHAGRNESTVDNPKFDQWRDMLIKYVGR